MSGGSFNYLYTKDDLPRSDLERMLGTLEHLRDQGVVGAAEAAEHTRAFLRRPSQELRSVWRTIEWWGSADYSREQVEEELRDFAEGEKTEALKKFKDFMKVHQSDFGYGLLDSRE